MSGATSEESQFSLSEEKQLGEEREFLAAFSLLTPGGQKKNPFAAVLEGEVVGLRL